MYITIAAAAALEKCVPSRRKCLGPNYLETCDNFDFENFKTHVKPGASPKLGVVESVCNVYSEHKINSKVEELSNDSATDIDLLNSDRKTNAAKIILGPHNYNDAGKLFR